ncbi:MAG: hypothetical protein NT015_11295 [Alphaproteobacteria bacterium]|nr:hypothetical protein [Alphaproteobacteria bacterium]
MSARRYALLAALALFIAFIASNVIANSRSADALLFAQRGAIDAAAANLRSARA